MADKLVTVSGAKTLYNDTRDRIEDLNSNKVGYAEVDDGYLILKPSEESDEIIAKLTGFGGGGGGGGGAALSQLTVINESQWLTKKVPEGSEVSAKITWSSTIDGIPTGLGTLVVKMDGAEVKHTDIDQGTFTETFSKYATTGSHVFQVEITDQYGSYRRLRFTVSYVAYGITSIFNDSEAYLDKTIIYTYTPYGSGTKLMHFEIDGETFMTKEIDNDGIDDSIAIPKGTLSHGIHKFEVYFETTDEDHIPSNKLSYEIIYAEPGNSIPIIKSSFAEESTLMQYNSAIISYVVYKATDMYTEVKLYMNGELTETLPQVTSDPKIWSVRLTEARDYTFKIVADGIVEREFLVHVTGLDVGFVADTENLALHLSSENRDNDAAPEERAKWEYTPDGGETISAVFNNFNWKTDGWIKDESTDYISVMRVKDEAKITIPYQPFSQINEGIRVSSGRTLEFEFKTTSVFDYNTDLISCYVGDRKVGFNITAQKMSLVGSSSSLSSQYKEDEHVRVTFVINPVGSENFMYCYINGIISQVAEIKGETFEQSPPAYITIGSPDAIIDLYRIRIYDKALNRFQVVKNWIADMQNSEDILKYAKENSIYKSGSVELDFETVKTNLTTLPYMVIDIDHTTSTDGTKIRGELPDKKGNKVLCNGYYVDPVDPYNSFSWINGELDVQGTSSQQYPIKNYKLKIKQSKTYGTENQTAIDCSGFIMTKASEIAGRPVIFKKYSMRGYDQHETFLKDKEANGWDGYRSIPTTTFVFKADFASSEGANNVELVRFYNQLATANKDIITPPQKNDIRYRIGIDGFPIVWFGDSKGKISFIGKYNFNNHKGTDEVYGLDMHGEVIDDDNWIREIEGVPDESWEMCDNNEDLTLWKRRPGTVNKVVIVNPEGKEVQYTDFMEEETTDYTILKDQCLSPLFEGSYPQSKMSTEEYDLYQTYQPEWSRYASIDDWMSTLRLKEIYDTGEALSVLIREQRDLLIPIIKRDIMTIFNLHEEQTPVSEIEDLLGVGGKGEEVAHTYEVRFPSEWYDAWTKKAIEFAKTKRLSDLLEWVASTNTTTATNKPLYEVLDKEPDPEFSVTYDKPYKFDNPEYRLAKFKYELPYYFNQEATLLYYIFTEMFLMIDSRAKNSFPTYFALTNEIYAMDKSDPTKHIFIKTEDTKKKKADKKYFKKVGSEYEEVALNVGDSTLDENEKPYYEWAMTEEEQTEEVTWADGRVTQWPKGRWLWFPYDMDTAIGINNEGLLVFHYSLEDTEALIGSTVVKLGTPNSVPVYNGSSTVLWNNVRMAFKNEIKVLYESYRDNSSFDYDTIEQMYEDHQSKWPAAIFNEDAYYKYIKPKIERNQPYLGMCLGSKEQQRKWWMYNRFKFLDSKYECGDAKRYQIKFRGNSVLNDKKIYITPYSDIYVKIDAGTAWESEPIKTYANERKEIVINRTTLGDTEAQIWSADRIKSIEKLNENLMISTFNAADAVNLQYLDVSSTMKIESMEHYLDGNVMEDEAYYKRIGTDSSGQPILERYYDATVGQPAKDDQGNWLYVKTSNKTLRGLEFGGNTLMRYINASNCMKLGDTSGEHTDWSTPAISLTACEQLESCNFWRTKVTKVELPSGGRLTSVILPNTITELNIVNQQKITNFQILNEEGVWDSSNIRILNIQNVNKEVEQTAIEIINGIRTDIPGIPPKLRFVGFDIEVKTVAELNTFLNHLITFSDKSLSGTITVTGKDEVLSYDRYAELKQAFSGSDSHLEIICKVEKKVFFKNYDGSTVFTSTFVNMSDEAQDVEYEPVNLPSRVPDDDHLYEFDGWSRTLDGAIIEDENDHRLIPNVSESLTLYAHYEVTPRYTVTFYNYDGTVRLSRVTINSKYETTATYNGAIPTAPSDITGYTAPFIGWGTSKYVGVDIEDSDNHRTIQNVTSNITIYAQMDWKISPRTIQVEKDTEIFNSCYYSGDVFNPEGLTVTVEKIIPSGTFRVAVLYSYDTAPFTEESRSIDLTVDENNIYPLEIGMAISMTADSKEAKPYQETNTDVDFSGFKFEITFSNGETRTVDWDPIDFEYTPLDFIETDGAKEVTFYYRNVSCTEEIFVLNGELTNIESLSWGLISRLVDNGDAQQLWSVGDKKTVYISGGVSDPYFFNGYYTFRILSFDHNIRGSKHYPNDTVFDKGDDHVYEYEQGKHTITFGFAENNLPVSSYYHYFKTYSDLTKNTNKMNKHYYVVLDDETTNPHGKNVIYTWNEEESSYILADNIHPTVASFDKGLTIDFASVDTGEWNQHWNGQEGGGCQGQTMVHNFINLLPSDLRAVIKEVTKGQADFYIEGLPEKGKSYGANVLTTQKEKIFIPSVYEIFGYTKASGDTLTTVDESKVCARYDYYAINDISSLRQAYSSTATIPKYMSPWFTRTLAYIRRSNIESYDNKVQCYFTSINAEGNLYSFTNRETSGAQNKGYLICFNV